MRSRLHMNMSSRQAIRERIESGELPCDGQHRIWAGKGGDHVCVVCREAIPATENEYEVMYPGPGGAVQARHFHFRCLHEWLAECREIQQTDGNGRQPNADGRADG
jgi:hypothetical protein